jgi:RNA polymerase sigma-70 factor (ECF subfamily)
MGQRDRRGGDAYQHHGRALLRKAERMLGSRADAQDLVQGLFVDLLSRGEPAPDLPYLYRAVTNRALTFLRDAQNRTRLLESNDDALRGPVRTRCDERVIGMDLLAKLTRTLDGRALEILVYRFFDDMTHDEIADLMGLSRKTVGRIEADIRAAVAELAGGAAR